MPPKKDDLMPDETAVTSDVGGALVIVISLLGACAVAYLITIVVIVMANAG